MTKESFLLYTEHHELIKELNLEQAGRLLNAIFEYSETDTVPELDPMTRLVFISIRQDLDRNEVKYNEKRRKMSENGKRGGRPKKDESEDLSLISADNKQEYRHSEPDDNLGVKNLDNINGDTPLSLSMTNSAKPQDDENNPPSHDSPLTTHENDTSDLTNNLYGNELPTACILSSEGEENRSTTDRVTDEEREALINYVKKKGLATRNPDAYVSKIIRNGDHVQILKKIKEIKQRKLEEEREKAQSPPQKPPSFIFCMKKDENGRIVLDHEALARLKAYYEEE